MNWNKAFARRTRYLKRSAVREFLKLTAQPGMISFAGGLPAPELFPVETVRRATQAVLTRLGGHSLQYGETEGVAELRDWIAARFSGPRVRVRRENVLIVSGAQQALDLIGRVFLDEGDAVAVENPTYLALLSAWRPLGARFLPVPSDAAGMDVSELPRLLHEIPKLIYVVPTFQNPLGTTLSLERRHALLRLAREHRVPVVEDDPYGELRYNGEPLARLFELDAREADDGSFDSNVLHVGTFSKVLLPGLRIGWVVSDDAVIDKLVQAKQISDLHTSTLNQHVTLELLRAGTLERQIVLLRDAYRARRDAMLAALERHFPAGTTWTRPDGGMFLTVTLPAEADATDLLQQAIDRQVAFVPGEEFHLEGLGKNTFRLNFSNPSPERIGEGIRRLGELLHRRPRMTSKEIRECLP